MRIIAITGILLLASLLSLTTQADELVLAENAPQIYLGGARGKAANLGPDLGVALDLAAQVVVFAHVLKNGPLKAPFPVRR